MHPGRWDEAALHARADDVLLPLEHAWVTTTTATVPPLGAPPSVDGAEVTAVAREGDALIVRIVRASDEAGRLEVVLDGGPARGWLVDLTGRPLAEVDGDLRLGPWEIATLRLDRP